MNYWLTTHWPRPKGTPASEPYADVWVKDGQWNVIEQLTPGDLVFIYESESGPLPLRRNIDGSTSARQKARGRAGIVALVRVIQQANQPPESRMEDYDNGEQMWWRYCAPTEPVNSGGFIPRSIFLPVLGYQVRWNLHGFGDNHSGVKRLSEGEFVRLRTIYEESAEAADHQRLANNTERVPFGGAGGEGPEHRALKERIAASPATVLGEEGLTLDTVEFPFRCTGDRIDIVLRDRDKKFVAVEVEVQCGESELAGPLQCMKYRSMLAYLYKRPLCEVRCILAAHEIAGEVSLHCDAFEIQTVVVPRASAQRSGE
jgi:hypothetical protein